MLWPEYALGYDYPKFLYEGQENPLENRHTPDWRKHEHGDGRT